MLTRDLLRYKVSGGYAKPSFIAADNAPLLEFAAQLISIHEQAAGCRREELEENVGRMTALWHDVKLARGLAKILNDRCIFSECLEQDYPALRRELFRRSARLLAGENCPAGAAAFREKVMEEETVLQQEIYADLPENERLLSLKKTFPRELLERYNLSLVQSLLLFSEGLECQVSAEDPALLRRLFKYLKFFRLLFRAELSGDRKKGSVPMIHLKIDGPASILENSTKYGLQLASFFPALCSMKSWKAASGLKLRDKPLRLALDETSKLVCPYTNFGAYIPEELKMFQNYFNGKAASWRLVQRNAYLRLEGNRLAFPDFRFRSDDGAEFDLELFHQWHKGPLAERLDFLEKHPETPLLLGADRACLKGDDALKERFSNLPGCFLFSSFPGVENVVKHLEEARAFLK
ncbi:MAG: hypothetical protein BWY31_02850 [Lentisphaerae bacterium ADurb.Bin242]|nr:MAG: hypothetical protein BWY31_02850 [Lentisphaerae bacterium ADurb.Bin242]